MKGFESHTHVRVCFVSEESFVYYDIPAFLKLEHGMALGFGFHRKHVNDQDMPFPVPEAGVSPASMVEELSKLLSRH